MFSDTICESRSTSSTPYLRWKDRTPKINDAISIAFQALVRDSKSGWGLYNGDDKYCIGGIKEHKLMRKIIQEAPEENKDFYALDIGAGNYQWGRKLARYLNKKLDSSKDITIHIIGIRGETNLDKAVKKIGLCKLYEFGQFQIETLENEFEKNGLQLANKVDLVVSRWCFRHLVDPVGTFTQAYDLLRPKAGYFLFDGFFFLHEDESMKDKSYNFNDRMTRLCLETGSPFLTYGYNNSRSLDHFVVSKSDNHPCRIHKQYLGTKELGWGWQVGSDTVTRFKNFNEDNKPLLYKGAYRGDKEIYERLRQNGLLHNSDLTWGPLQSKDNHKKIPPFHNAIVNGDEESIYRCLQEGCDINESDEKGFTPLHLAIKHNNYKLFLLLLEKGALTNLFAGRLSPLHLAVQHDFNGCFISALIEAGVDVNLKPKNGFDRFRLRPLDCAIEYANIKAVELLLAANAIVNYSNRKSLDSNPAFSSTQHLLPKRLSQLEGFDSIINHIKKGDCVYLAYPKSFTGYKFHQQGEGKLIQITVNPKTRLLDDNNFKEIEDMSDCKGELFFKTAGEIFDLEFQFGY